MNPFRFCPRRVFASILFVLFSALALAEAPPAQTQVPGYYRFALGGFQITALYDGPTNLDAGLFKNAPRAEIQKQLARFFIDGPALQTAVNAFLVSIDGKLALIDTGAAKLFGPNLGRIVNNLQAAGYSPDQIDIVLLTHPHGDHVNGLITPEGERVFVNADIWSSKGENDFWLDRETTAKAPNEAKPFFKIAQDAASPYLASGQWKIFSGEQELLPGIHTLETSGHTPGHTSYLLRNGGKTMIVLGDLVHNHAIQFSRPDVAIEFDTHPKKAVAARKTVFARASREKLLVAGMHLPFPGIGHIRQEGKTFVWVPVEFAPLPQELK